jgi:hypothetical protein
VGEWKVGAISPAPSDEEVAAITAAIAVVEGEMRAQATAAAPAANAKRISAWVEASRRSAQRAALQRGPWRLSGRIGRRSRA